MYARQRDGPFSRGYFKYASPVSRSGVVIVVSVASPTSLVEGNFTDISFRGARNVSRRYVTEKELGERGQECFSESRKRRVPGISRFLRVHEDRLHSPFRGVSFTDPLFLHLFLCFFFPVVLRPAHSIFMDATRCLAALPAASFSLFFRDSAQEEEEVKAATEWGCFFGAIVCSAGYFLSCGKRRMWRTRTKHRIVLWPSADLSSQPSLSLSSPFLQQLLHTSLYSLARSTVSTSRSSIPTAFSGRLEPANSADLCGFNPDVESSETIVP